MNQINDNNLSGRSHISPPLLTGDDRRINGKDEPGRICLRIAVDVPVKGAFSYLAPEKEASIFQVGCMVKVPFKNQKVTGYVLEKIPLDNKLDLKEISSLVYPEPLFHEQMVPFFEWIARYYVYPVGQVIKWVLPGGMSMNSCKTASLTDLGMSILKTLTPGSEEQEILKWVKDNPGKRTPWPIRRLVSFEKKGWLIISERTGKRRMGPLERKFGKINDPDLLNAILAQKPETLKANDELEFLKTVSVSGDMLLKDLTARFKTGSYLVNKWRKKGALKTYTRVVYRNPAGNIIFPSKIPEKLYKQQIRALDYINAAIDRGVFSSCLLFGVTGSGKTEVYCRAAEHAVRRGRQVILMVPEIALANYMEGLVRSRVGSRVAIYHSGLGRGERYDEWMRMVRGEVDIVIGARSALFAPLPRLGLIIVDEEHDPAYKEEGGIRYQARDAAVVRAKIEKAVVVHGSGTPSVQSYENCLSGRYHLLSMPERVEKRPPPEVEIVDMRTLKDTPQKKEMLSPRLKEAISQNLTAGNQTILFLNRRGFHRLFLCRSCGESIRCPNCDVALVYHLKEDRLSCHYCGFHSGTQLKCSSCGRKGLKAYGFGTEKLEQEIKGLFPGARISRLDTDTTQKKGRTMQILKQFSDHETDILVGTQMLTKGYDFPMVTLVGVIAADLSLSFPDFRAGERTFQILSQVVGRAGRGSRSGRVIIQTFNPDNYAICAAAAHDYQSFFNNEKELRKQLGYPPFLHLTGLRLQGNSEKKTAESAQRVGRDMREILSKWPERGKELQVLGPVEASISKIKGKYRWQILVKSKSISLMRHYLLEVERISKKTLQSSGVQLISDIDPYQMM